MRAFHDLVRLEVSAHLVDARGRPCPQPIVDLARGLREHPRIELWADDPAARADLVAFCAATGHRLTGESSGEAMLQALVERGVR
jgi:tRNA 2-thiouridine synthesizing protein A